MALYKFDYYIIIINKLLFHMAKIIKTV